jgi:hypothetical protein
VQVLSSRKELLATLSFGRVDAESVDDLDRRFLKTADFDRIVSTDAGLILGPKGSGKSTIFELFSRFEDSARQLAGPSLVDVRIATGTGLLDLGEIATDDLEQLKSENGYDHVKLWRLYIAVKCAMALSDQGMHSSGPVREILRATGSRKDFRILPLLRGLWRAIISPSLPVSGLKIGALGASLEFPALGKAKLDVLDLLQDVHDLLEETGQRMWLLFDKIDELYPGDRAERQRALEALLTATMSLRRSFPRIEPKIFLRSDIWPTLSFTNKTHLQDKQVRLNWSRKQIVDLILKGAAASPGIENLVRQSVPAFSLASIESLSRSQAIKALAAIMPARLKSHGEDHETSTWLFERIRDAHGDAFPRDIVFWLNYAADFERKSTGRTNASDKLLRQDTLSTAYAKVSKARREAFLAEFPGLQAHFDRFEGQEGPQFSRQELYGLMRDLSPAEDEMLRALHEVGVLRPLDGGVMTASCFEVPLLYREGLSLTTNHRI